MIRFLQRGKWIFSGNRTLIRKVAKRKKNLDLIIKRNRKVPVKQLAVAITIFSFVLLIREREVFCLSSSRESFGRVKFQTSNWIWKRILLLSHFSDYCSVRFVVIERTQCSNWNMLKNAFPGIFHAQPTQPNDKKNGTTNLIRSLNRLTQSVLQPH